MVRASAGLKGAEVVDWRRWLKKPLLLQLLLARAFVVGAAGDGDLKAAADVESASVVSSLGVQLGVRVSLPEL